MGEIQPSAKHTAHSSASSTPTAGSSSTGAAGTNNTEAGKGDKPVKNNGSSTDEVARQLERQHRAHAQLRSSIPSTPADSGNREASLAIDRVAEIRHWTSSRIGDPASFANDKDAERAAEAAANAADWAYANAFRPNTPQPADLTKDTADGNPTTPVGGAHRTAHAAAIVEPTRTHETNPAANAGSAGNSANDDAGKSGNL